jgi:hypothetical protein
MLTMRTRIVGAGTLAPKRSVMPSSGWMRSTNESASRYSATSKENGRCGTCRNWTATSVTRLGRRLPVRM